MTTIEDFLSVDPELRCYAALPEMDPLTELDALQEAQLLEVRFDTLRSTVGLLLELRAALQLREANTGVLVGYGVREISWSAQSRSTSMTAWNIIASVPRCEDRLFKLSLRMLPQAELELSAASAAFYVGDVPGLEGPPPDYVGDNEATIRARLAGWHSAFTPVHAAFLDPAP